MRPFLIQRLFTQANSVQTDDFHICFLYTRAFFHFHRKTRCGRVGYEDCVNHAIDLTLFSSHPLIGLPDMEKTDRWILLRFSFSLSLSFFIPQGAFRGREKSCINCHRYLNPVESQSWVSLRPKRIDKIVCLDFTARRFLRLKPFFSSSSVRIDYFPISSVRPKPNEYSAKKMP